LTNVWWQNIGKNIRCSETKFGQLFGIKHGRIVVHVSTVYEMLDLDAEDADVDVDDDTEELLKF
jgi:hypothetical protein